MILNILIQNEIMKKDINGIENLTKEKKKEINIMENLMREKTKEINVIEIMIMKETGNIKNMIMKVKETGINATENTKMKEKVLEINILENMTIKKIEKVKMTKDLTTKTNTHQMMENMKKRHCQKNIQIIMTNLKNIKKVLKTL